MRVWVGGAPEAVRGVVHAGSPIPSRGRLQSGALRVAHLRVTPRRRRTVPSAVSRRIGRPAGWLPVYLKRHGWVRVLTFVRTSPYTLVLLPYSTSTFFLSAHFLAFLYCSYVQNGSVFFKFVQIDPPVLLIAWKGGFGPKPAEFN